MKPFIVFTFCCVTFSFSACSMFTAQGRREAAYARYVRHSSNGRVHQQKLFRSSKPAMPVTPSEPTDPTVSAGPVAYEESVQ